MKVTIELDEKDMLHVANLDFTHPCISFGHKMDVWHHPMYGTIIDGMPTSYNEAIRRIAKDMEEYAEYSFRHGWTVDSRILATIQAIQQIASLENTFGNTRIVSERIK